MWSFEFSLLAFVPTREWRLVRTKVSACCSQVFKKAHGNSNDFSTSHRFNPPFSSPFSIQHNASRSCVPPICHRCRWYSICRRQLTVVFSLSLAINFDSNGFGGWPIALIVLLVAGIWGIVVVILAHGLFTGLNRPIAHVAFLHFTAFALALAAFAVALTYTPYTSCGDSSYKGCNMLKADIGLDGVLWWVFSCWLLLMVGFCSLWVLWFCVWIQVFTWDVGLLLLPLLVVHDTITEWRACWFLWSWLTVLLLNMKF